VIRLKSCRTECSLNGKNKAASGIGIYEGRSAVLDSILASRKFNIPRNISHP
jgi:hypothetical protein